MVYDVQEEDGAHHADERHVCLPLCAEELEGAPHALVYAAPYAGICDDSPRVGSSSDTEFVEEQVGRGYRHHAGNGCFHFHAGRGFETQSY